MLTVGAIAFANGAILSALLLLPLIWWLLRVMPPLPQRLSFPAIALLFGLRQDEDTPDKTPLWLLLLRLAVAGLIILAFAQPLLNPSARVPGNGAILIVVDDGWAAARHWTERQTTLEDLFERAERDGRAVALLGTAPRADGQPIAATRLAPASETRAVARALQPKPWASDRAAALAAIDAAALSGPVSAVWLADGIADPAARRLAERLQRLGMLTVFDAPAADTARLLRPPRRDGNSLIATAERASADAPDLAIARAMAVDGRPLGRVELRFAEGQTRTEGRLDLPGEIMNEAVRVAIEGETSAGATVLLDEAWRRRTVGILGAGPSQAGHPLLDDQHYLAGAFAGFADARRGTAAELIEAGAAVIVLTDAVPLGPEDRGRLTEWIAKGGTLLRFAGPRITEEDDALVPVKLRRGSRALGGALTWSQPQKLAPFDKASPFAGIAVPDDVTVLRQILAEPSVELGGRTWAALEDGTPLVTGVARERGTLILVHLAANAEWSNLPISGLFIEMLQRIVASSQGTAGQAGDAPLPPLELIDGFARPVAPGTAAKPLLPVDFATATPGPEHPPGYYGTESGRRAFNLSARLGELRPLGDLPAGTGRAGYANAAEVDLRPWLLVAAVVLAMADLLASLALRGNLGRMRVGTKLGAVALAFMLFVPGSGHAADEPRPQIPPGPDKAAIEATMDLRLAYVITGDAEVDRISRDGLAGLTQILERRTSVEAGPPVGIDPEADDITFYPLLYWPIAPTQALLSEQARSRLARYLGTGGVVLFDTRDQGTLGAGADGMTPERQKLRLLLRGLSIPPLAPVPADHVLTKSFYLLTEFPGRWTGGVVWLDPAGTERNDGVSPIIMGGHDWASAWAIDQNGAPRFPVVPGGEPQREYAYRFGVNLVMHVLTGNYKADQVHVPSILQRLGE